ncbi:MAG TPA: hypothetical protein PLF21_07720 [Exilispira sp.]|nr:hypothetical protein [Exilispira sp.]
MNLVDLKNIFLTNSKFFSLPEDLIRFYFEKYIDSFEFAKDGNPNFKLNNKYLYSKYKPLDKFIKYDFQNKNRLIFIENGIGLSVYYFLNFILNSIKIDELNLTVIFSSFLSFILSLFIVDYSKIKNFNQNLKKFIIVIYLKDETEKNKIFTNKKNLFIEEKYVSEKISLLQIENLKNFCKFIEEYFDNNFDEINDFDRFKLILENPISLIHLNNLESCLKDFDLKKIIQIINDEAQKRLKSISTEKHFSSLWKRNIMKNFNIIEEKSWKISNSDFIYNFNFDFSKKRGILFWGASDSVEKFLNNLNEEEISLINKYFYSISIVSSVKLLFEKGIDINYQVLFDAGFFGYFNVEDFSIPFILSMIIHPSILKKLSFKPIFVNLLTEEEIGFDKLKNLPSFPFYGSTLPTLYKQFQLIYINSNIKLFFIGSSFRSDEERSHHKRYPLYRYVISKSSYLNTLLKWETLQKIINTQKFQTYRNSLKNINILNEEDFINEIIKIKNSLKD